MKSVSDNDASRPVMQQKNRCVWMEAGILSYLLCDREFECKRCPLDEAMRSHYSPLHGKADAPAADVESRGDRTDDRMSVWTGSTEDHVTFTVIDDGVLRVSLERIAADLLPPVKSVVLPVPGRKLSSGSFCCWFIFEGGTLPIRIPFHGTVTGINSHLVEEPHLATHTSAGDGWLFDIRPSDPSGALRPLLSPEEAEARNFEDMEIYRRLIAGCVSPPDSGGQIMMQDGGHPVEDLPSVIGPVKYLEIVRRAFWGKR